MLIKQQLITYNQWKRT